jgi:hypothetical protein
MGAFNTLHVETDCPECGQRAHFDIQFKYGSCWQYDYVLGDRIRWGGNDFGEQGLVNTVILGTGEPCPICQTKFPRFAIELESDRIVLVRSPEPNEKLEE